MNRRLRWLAVVACVGMIATSSALLWARQGIVRTKDNRTVEGDITEKADQVVLTIRGIKTTIDRENIVSIDYFDNVEAQYKDRVAKLPKNPTAGDRLAIARWLFDVKSYDMAMREVASARRLEPNNAEAATLEQTILSQQRLERSRPVVGGTTTPPPAGTRPAAGGATTDKPVVAGEKKLLGAAEINAIRQLEWRDNDPAAPRATVPPDLRRRFVDLKALDPGTFAALSQPAQAFMILREGTPEMRKEIKVTSDPTMLADFRRVIQPLVINYCATAGCHGGPNAGKFFLYNTNTEREDVAYTNFYILRKYRQAFGDREYSMLDPQYENMSILLQFALPPDQAELKHPELKGQTYRPVAPNKNGPNYRVVMTWMMNLSVGEPNYGFSIPLPGSKATTAPAATQPAATRPVTRPAAAK